MYLDSLVINIDFPFQNSRLDERFKLQEEIARAKEDHRVEVMAYRRALSTEEAKVVSSLLCQLKNKKSFLGV